MFLSLNKDNWSRGTGTTSPAERKYSVISVYIDQLSLYNLEIAGKKIKGKIGLKIELKYLNIYYLRNNTY
jgi:hypothetical protein